MRSVCKCIVKLPQSFPFAIDCQIMSQGPIGGSRYHVVEANPLGGGSFGKVYKARDDITRELVVVKVIPKEKCLRGYMTTEMLNHRQLHHPNVIGFRGFWISGKNVNLVMELANGGTLFKFLQQYPGRRLPEDLARYFFQQLVLAVDYCHKKGVANRDVKLENLLLHEEVHGQLPVLKLADWGYSRDAVVDATTAVGTPHYMAPQPLRNYRMRAQQTYSATAADIWSCGVCLYQLLTDKYPFSWDISTMDFSTMDLMLQRMQAGPAAWDRPEVTGHLSPQVKQLLEGLMAADEQQRMTIRQIAANDWFRTNLDPRSFDRNDDWVVTPPREGLPSADAIEASMISALGQKHGAARHGSSNSSSAASNAIPH